MHDEQFGFILAKNGKFVRVCEYEQEVIKLVLELRQNNYSFRAITKEINEQGYRSRAGTCFGVSQIFRLCKTHGVNAQEKPKKDVVHVAKRLRAQGLSLRAITREINEQGYRSRVGKAFHLTQVVRMLKKKVSI